MNLLLDTNAFIWFSEDDEKLSKKAKLLLEDEDNRLFISVVTFWEIAIKKSINKLEMSLSLKELYEKAIEVGFEIIPIEYEHVHSASSTLPRLWPTGSSVGWPPLITAWYFSSSPSDPPPRGGRPALRAFSLGPRGITPGFEYDPPVRDSVGI